MFYVYVKKSKFSVYKIHFTNVVKSLWLFIMLLLSAFTEIKVKSDKTYSDH